ncbi:thiol:disulfide interchange protein DsbA/DsbL [Sedimenticola hydrogenitrophicus]|uniref:thiol:disulfide interchange protein DsbA/DsbL n=1 Tax=Sedimenticola hydrogenitrophicus TaxID=2967975 RepID=UPI0021A89216|nr:thiol:disulfide interchange protein DsbA/DsbL [Sedimenticola hydrogenitrophicus]
MKKLTLIRVLSLFVFMFLAAGAPAQTPFEEEVHYFSIIPEQPGAEGDKVQVVEFFWYACPHCYKLEPHIGQWLERKPDAVEFVRIPAMFKRADVVLHAKTFYALTLMGVEDELNAAIFDEIHVRKNRLATAEDMEALLADKGVDVEAYRKAMKSFAVQTQSRRAEVLAGRFDIRGVPAFVVDGKYRTSGLEGDLQMQAIDYLIDKVIAEKRAKKQ